MKKKKHEGREINKDLTKKRWKYKGIERKIDVREVKKKKW